MRKTFSLINFGCRVNQAEMESLRSRLISRSWKEDTTHPSVTVINSCAVTAKAEHEVRQTVNRQKRTDPDTVIVVTGCAATRWLHDREQIQHVDYLYDNTAKNALADILDALPATRTPDLRYDGQPVTDKFLSSGRLFIKLQDGCARFCSFCIVPYLRGKPVSSTIGEIIGRINAYTDIGTDIRTEIREVVLAGINTEYFGKGNGETLPQLLDAILERTSVDRISFGSIHPWSITDGFLDWYRRNAANPRFVHFFHIPLQSGSDTILKLMNRGYTAAGMMEKLHALKSVNPDVQIGTDVIVGFQEETPELFGETYDFIGSAPVDRLHVFRFSNRIGTAAYRRKASSWEPASADKQTRSRRLISLGKTKYRNFLGQLQGKSTTVLVLKEKDNGFLRGLTGQQVEVLIPDLHIPAGSIISARYPSGNLESVRHPDGLSDSDKLVVEVDV